MFRQHTPSIYFYRWVKYVFFSKAHILQLQVLGITANGHIHTSLDALPTGVPKPQEEYWNLFLQGDIPIVYVNVVLQTAEGWFGNGSRRDHSCVRYVLPEFMIAISSCYLRIYSPKPFYSETVPKKLLPYNSGPTIRKLLFQEKLKTLLRRESRAVLFLAFVQEYV